MNLEQLIQNEILVASQTNHKGWNPVKCAICNDYKPRGGWKFEDGNIVYSCFNCAHKAVYKSGSQVSKKFKDTLISFGINETDINACIGIKSLFDKNASEPENLLKYPKEIKLPNHLEDICESKSVWVDVAKEYLDFRIPGITIKPKSFYISPIKKPGFLYFPFYFKNKLVYWQGRSMDDSIQKWDTCPENTKSDLFYNMDEIFQYSANPIFVTEGIFDSIAINGVSLLGSTLSNNQIQFLNKTKRDKIFVIDKDKNGKKLASQIIDLGWQISVLSTDVKDVNDSVRKFGKIWTVQDILNNTCSGITAKLKSKFL